MILYTIACCALGYFEAILFHYADHLDVVNFNRRFGDIHRHFVVIRIILYLWAFGFTFDALIYLLPCCLMFPMWHDGVYYVARKYFVHEKIYISAFVEYSESTTAKMSYPFWIRFIMWLAGGILWVLL